MSNKVWEEIIYLFSDFNDIIFEVCKSISNFILHFIMYQLLFHAGINVDTCQ